MAVWQSFGKINYFIKKGKRKMREELRPDVEFEKEKKLIDDGILDSFDIVSLVGELNDAFDVSINVQDLLPENFNCVDAMVELIENLQEEE